MGYKFCWIDVVSIDTGEEFLGIWLDFVHTEKYTEYNSMQFRYVFLYGFNFIFYKNTWFHMCKCIFVGVYIYHTINTIISYIITYLYNNILRYIYWSGHEWKLTISRFCFQNLVCPNLYQRQKPTLSSPPASASYYTELYTQPPGKLTSLQEPSWFLSTVIKVEFSSFYHIA